MPDQATVGEVIAAFLENCGISTAYGVISIHNMPILDAIGRRAKIRFVPARGEAGACGMADGHARVTGDLGVVFTSTGTAAGNAAGGLVEARTAGTPLLHITGQVETHYLDRDRAYIHEAPDQLTMLKSVSKTAYRVWSPQTALATMKQAVCEALTPPSGPVSVEIPVDVQASLIDWPDDLSRPNHGLQVTSNDAIDRLAELLANARRPLLWLGGGAARAGSAAARLVNMGFAVVSTTQGRGIVPEDHPRTIGAFTQTQASEKLFLSSDGMLVVGSRLRGNETLKHRIRLPAALYQTDADLRAEGRNYPPSLFVHGDARQVLDGLADRLDGRMDIDPVYHGDIASTRAANEEQMRAGLGPYDRLVDALQEAAGSSFSWVRDITISNSTWGNKLLKIFAPGDGVHAVGGGIGQGLSMAIGAAIGAPDRPTFCLVGDGGLQLNMCELATAAQENTNIVIVLMNSGGYGVIRNIQDAQYGGRHYFTDLLTPNFSRLCGSMGIAHNRIRSLDGIERHLQSAMSATGPAVLELDMPSIGDFTDKFAGPPARQKIAEPAQ